MRSRRLAWASLWGLFSLLSFPAIWYAIVILRSLLPTDASPNTLRALTVLVGLLALAAQPGAWGWLWAVLHRDLGLKTAD
jgi:hypothetical protein